MGELQQEACPQSNQGTNDQTAKEDDQEDANTLKEAQGCQSTLETVLVILCRFKQYNSNSIVQDRLAEDHGVEFRVDFVSIEDS